MKILRLLVVGLFVVEATRADDLDDASFGLRFQAALTRFSRYPDVAGVAGASVAAEWGSSTNPAGLGWAPLEGVSSQYSLLGFDNGTDLHVFSVSYSADTEKAGVFQPSLGRDVEPGGDDHRCSPRAFLYEFVASPRGLHDSAAGAPAAVRVRDRALQ